jgi:phosphoglycerate kinase
MTHSNSTPDGADTLQDIQSYNFQGLKALVRVDYNVPLDEAFQVTDDTRIRRTIPTLRKILDGGGAAILMAHLGRPKTGPEEKFSLKHVQSRLAELLDAEVLFSNDCIGEEAEAKAAGLNPGQVLLLENLRFHPEEKAGDADFAKKLAGLADVYVNDAFGTAHRAHASTAVIAQYFNSSRRMFGALMATEITQANRVFQNAEKPFTAVLGGAKVSGKIMIIERLMDMADRIIIGGGMAYTFHKAMGGNVGSSLVEDDRLDTAREVIELAKQKGIQLLIPEDSVVADAFSNDAQTQILASGEIPEGWMGLDIGPKALEAYQAALADAKTILWNGPMGVFEMENFQKGTKQVALAIVDSTASGAYSLVGGGDSVAAVNQFELGDKVSYVSTGGGAMLEFFEGKELPGIAAMQP